MSSGVLMQKSNLKYNIRPRSQAWAMTLKFVIILQNLIKAYHRKSGKSKYDRKVT